MTRRLQENLISVLLLALFVAAIVEASGYGPRARMVPVIVASLGILFVIVQALLFNLRRNDAMTVDVVEVISARATGDDDALPDDLRRDMAQAVGGGPEEPADWSRARRELRATGVILLAALMFVLFGPIITMFAYSFGYLVLSGQYGWVRAALASTALSLFVYGLFYLWLGVDLDVGALNPDIGLW